VVSPQTQTRKYWVSNYTVSDTDIEQIYNHFLEVERPQTIEELARIVMTHRVAEEKNEIRRRLAGRTVYRPQNSFKVGEELVFPALKFAYGKVKAARTGYNPVDGSFKVIAVDMNGKEREFAAELTSEHPLNAEDGVAAAEPTEEMDAAELVSQFGSIVADKLSTALATHAEFIRLGRQWFVRGLMAEVNIGHLHLTEAILEMNEGGPLPAESILVDLDMDANADEAVKKFSLNHALLKDERFDEVGPPGKVAWFLRRLEPEAVRETPERLRHTPIHYDRALLTPQLLLLERELDDEWSELEPETTGPQPTLLALMYPHRWSGTLPLSSRTRPLFPTGISARQRITLVDDQNGEEIMAWVVGEQRYIYGLTDWYAANDIPVGGFISLRPGPEVGRVLLGYDRRKPQKEWARVATVEENRLKFTLDRRSIGCGYDDLLIVATDYVAAVDALRRRLEERPLANLIAELFPQLAALNPQNTVHAKTLYSALNMVRRVPPGPIFAELVRHPAFQTVGDHYWQYNGSRV
jgi:hypothetical protein